MTDLQDALRRQEQELVDRIALGVNNAELQAHLDVCRQCAKHPFSMCSTGAELLDAVLPCRPPRARRRKPKRRKPKRVSKQKKRRRNK